MKHFAHSHFFTLLLLASGALAAAGTAHSATLAYEGFDYATGDLGTSNGGFGWGGTWTGTNANTDVVSTSLSFTGVSTSGEKATASFSGGATRALDTSGSGNFSAYIDGNGDIGADGTTLWFSLLAEDNSTLPRVWRLQRDGATIGAIGDGGNTNFWHFAHGASVNGGSPGPGGDASAGDGDSTGVSSTTGTAFIVGRIDFVSGVDTAYVWINPVVANGEPLIGSADESATGNWAFDTLQWSVGGGQVSFVDEYRFGETFDDVTQTVLAIPEPSTAALLMITGLLAGATIRRRRCG